MICVTVDHRSMELTMQGHADAQRNEQDHDLVCCAASTLLQALVYTLMDRDGISVMGDMESGHAHIRIKASPQRMDTAQAAFRMAADGLQMLAEAYPDSINIQK